MNPVRDAGFDSIGLHVHTNAKNRGATAAFQNQDTSPLWTLWTPGKHCSVVVCQGKGWGAWIVFGKRDDNLPPAKLINNSKRLSLWFHYLALAMPFVGSKILDAGTGAQRLMFAGYWEWDLKTRKYARCDEMYWIVKLPPQQPMRTATFFHSIHPEDRGKVVKALGKALVGEQPYNLEHRIVWPDGAVRSVHGKASGSGKA